MREYDHLALVTPEEVLGQESGTLMRSVGFSGYCPVEMLREELKQIALERGYDVWEFEANDFAGDFLCVSYRMEDLVGGVALTVVERDGSQVVLLPVTQVSAFKKIFYEERLEREGRWERIE